jgi:hypothetical protein
MKKMLVSSLAIAGMVMLVGCGGGNTVSSNPDTPSNPGTPSNPDTPSNPETPVGNNDTLKIVKTDDTHFNIEWNKGYKGYSQVIYSGPHYDGDPKVHDKRILTDNYNGIHTLTCVFSKVDDPNVEGSSAAAYYNCEGTGPTYNGSTHTIYADFRLVLNKDYTIHRQYGTAKEDQGVDYVISYTNGVLTGL